MADLLVVRPTVGPERDAVRSLLADAVGRGPHGERALELLDRADAGPGAEYLAYVVAQQGLFGGERVVGALVAERVAGAAGTIRVHALAGRGTGTHDAAAVRERLVAALAERARREGGRLLVAELPDEPALRPMRDALLAAGFAEEGRVADLVRDGVALLLLRRDL
ncbi:MAG TPA: hypothetical protein VNA89_09555 [Gemmatimonadaceae bacterium]|nr:hypothetical protein [Gemmatimonadaceae bacterium]